MRATSFLVTCIHPVTILNGAHSASDLYVEKIKYKNKIKAGKENTNTTLFVLGNAEEQLSMTYSNKSNVVNFSYYL